MNLDFQIFGFCHFFCKKCKKIENEISQKKSSRRRGGAGGGRVPDDKVGCRKLARDV